jgi:hypothetical protein
VNRPVGRRETPALERARAIAYHSTAAGTRGRPVSTGALAFHEFAEAYATVDGGQQYLPLASGSHATAAARERALVSQRPTFTQGLAGVELTR